MKKAILSAIGVFLFSLACATAVEESESTEQKNSKFFYVSGDKIFNQQKEEFQIKGISFGNSVWENTALPSKTHHTEDSYKEIAMLGFNSVRFYLNYKFFEDDEKPYKYKQSGFNWLDKNIEWAKKYNIKLILNMHVPQGGFQSQGEGMKLWTVKSNQERLSSLWKEIAERYADEATIIGFGLINEPIIPYESTIKKSIDTYRRYIKDLVKIIREVDKNHIFFIENPLSIKNMKTGEMIYKDHKEFNQFLIDDKNVVYEFHDYSPYSFTHQDTEWANTKGIVKYYPSSQIISFDSDNEWIGCQKADKTTNSKNGWVYYESKPVTKTDEYNLGKITCQVLDTGKSGIVYFDEIKVTKYDKKGIATTHILVNPIEKSELWFWSKSKSGSYGSSDKVGFNDKSSMYIKGVTDDANFAGKVFELEEGCSYVISAWVKRENCKAGTISNPRIDFINASNVQSFNKDYMESSLKRYIEFYNDNNVPVYLGEFGVVSGAFAGNRGALQWVRDVIDLCKKYEVNFNYHTYHEVSFGLYMNSDYELPDKLNKKLAKLFKEIL